MWNYKDTVIISVILYLKLYPYNFQEIILFELFFKSISIKNKTNNYTFVPLHIFKL
jgi:hypothetical protein